MTREEYDNLKIGDTVYFVEGGFPECNPWIEKDKVSGKEKYEGRDMVWFENACCEAIPYRYCFLTIEKARKALKRQIKADEKWEEEIYNEQMSMVKQSKENDERQRL